MNKWLIMTAGIAIGIGYCLILNVIAYGKDLKEWMAWVMLGSMAIPVIIVEIKGRRRNDKAK